jgi:hypothetical protein
MKDLIKSTTLSKAQQNDLNHVLNTVITDKNMSSEIKNAHGIVASGSFTMFLAWLLNTKIALSFALTWIANGKKMKYGGVEYTNKELYWNAKNSNEKLRFSTSKLRACLKLAKHLFGVDGSPVEDIQNNIENIVTWIENGLITNLEKDFINLLNADGTLSEDKNPHFFKSEAEIEAEIAALEKRTKTFKPFEDAENEELQSIELEVVLDNPRSKKEREAKQAQAITDYLLLKEDEYTKLKDKIKVANDKLKENRTALKALNTEIEDLKSVIVSE